MEQSITRVMEGSPTQEVLNPSERLNFESALKAVTIGAAWQIFADSWIGSLGYGKLADFVILDEDPFARSSYAGLRNVRVDQTWVNGERVYTREGQ